VPESIRFGRQLYSPYMTNSNASVPCSAEVPFTRLEPPEPIGHHAPVPTELTAKVLRDTLAGKDLVHCDSAADMFRKLGI
jgi:hypothetical protein